MVERVHLRKMGRAREIATGKRREEREREIVWEEREDA